MNNDFLVFGSPAIGDEEIDEVVDSLRSGWLGTGPKVAKFEEMFKEYTGAKHAVAMNSCTAGLHLALIAAGIGTGDEVITSPMTFAATGNVILHSGASPVFVDIDRETMNMAPGLIEEKITPRTKAILPVHFAGRPCDMESIMEIAKRHDLTVIEDAAHAVETRYHGKKIGTIGDITSFSFYVNKNLCTGEGGMLTTDNDEWADAFRIMRLHGISKDAWKRYSKDGFKHYEVLIPGFKYNMMDIQAAMGIHQLSKVERFLKRRNEIWEHYDRHLSALPFITPSPQENSTRHARHLYTLLVKADELKMTRNEFQERLYQQNIGTGIHFYALHLHHYYQKSLGYKRGDFPVAEDISDTTISLPLSPKLSDEDVGRVIDAVNRIVGQERQ